MLHRMFTLLVAAVLCLMSSWLLWLMAHPRQVIAAFESRMNDREEVQVARLLEDSVGSLSLNDSAANSDSPARYRMVLCFLLC